MCLCVYLPLFLRHLDVPVWQAAAYPAFCLLCCARQIKGLDDDDDGFGSFGGMVMKKKKKKRNEEDEETGKGKKQNWRQTGKLW